MGHNNKQSGEQDSSMPGSTYSQDTVGEEKKQAQKTSITLFYAVVSSFAAAVLWLLSFSSPYWLASWEDTRTDQRFLNMGLWTFCFDRFRFPRNQYDRMYNGCHPIWGYEYREIREWMAPWWLMLIQFISAPAFLLMNIALVIDVALYPNYNYPSWSYGVAVFAMIINGVAAFFMWMEAVEAKERKERNQNLLMMMYPSAGFGTGTMSSYHGSQFI